MSGGVDRWADETSSCRVLCPSGLDRDGPLVVPFRGRRRHRQVSSGDGLIMTADLRVRCGESIEQPGALVPAVERQSDRLLGVPQRLLTTRRQHPHDLPKRASAVRREAEGFTGVIEPHDLPAHADQDERHAGVCLCVLGVMQERECVMPSSWFGEEALGEEVAEREVGGRGVGRLADLLSLDRDGGVQCRQFGDALEVKRRVGVLGRDALCFEVRGSGVVEAARSLEDSAAQEVKIDGSRVFRDRVVDVSLGLLQLAAAGQVEDLLEARSRDGLRPACVAPGQYDGEGAGETSELRQVGAMHTEAGPLLSRRVGGSFDGLDREIYRKTTEAEVSRRGAERAA